MKTGIVAAVLILFCGIIGSAEENGLFHIQVSVAPNQTRQASLGSGGFMVPDGVFGRISIIFGDDLDQFVIKSAGSLQIPISRNLDTGPAQGSMNNASMVLDIYLKPEMTPEGKIQLTGVLDKSTRMKGVTQTAYIYTEDKLDYIMDSGGRKELAVGSGVPGESIKLTFTVDAIGDISSKPQTVRQVTFESDYSLYDNDAGEYLTRDCHCALGMTTDYKEGAGSCLFRMTFHLADTGILLYISDFSIDHVSWNEAGSISFNFTANHLYAFNPEDTLAMPDDINSEKMTVTVLNKSITALPGEKLEIEIPGDPDSPLPFHPTETIILRNTVIAQNQ